MTVNATHYRERDDDPHDKKKKAIYKFYIKYLS